MEHLLGGNLRLHGNDAGHFRASHGHRAGLVEDQRVGLGQQFQVIAALDEDSIPRRRADGSRQGGCRGEPDAARVVDDEHVQRAAALARHQIHDQSQQEIDRNELGREAVGDGLDVRLAVRGLLDHVDDPGHGGLVAHLHRANHQPAALDDGSGKHLVPLGLAQGHVFAGNRRLIDRRLARLHHPVHADLLAGVDHDPIVGVELIEVHALLRAIVLQPPDGLFADRKHVADRAAGAAHRIGGEQFGDVGQPNDRERREPPAAGDARQNRGGAERISIRTKRGCQRTQSAAEDGDCQRGSRQRRNGKEPARERGRPVAHWLAEKVVNERCGGDSDANEHVGERPLLQPPLVHGRAVLFGPFGLIGSQ